MIFRITLILISDLSNMKFDNIGALRPFQQARSPENGHRARSRWNQYRMGGASECLRRSTID